MAQTLTTGAGGAFAGAKKYLRITVLFATALTGPPLQRDARLGLLGVFFKRAELGFYNFVYNLCKKSRSRFSNQPEEVYHV